MGVLTVPSLACKANFADAVVCSIVNRRQYLAGTGVLVSSGAIGATETGRAHENNDSSNRTGEETDGGQRPATRTVLHLSSDDVAEQEMALMNAKNLLEDPTVDNREIRFVANMRAIFAYVEGESEHADLVRSLAESGVEFKACENAMATLDVSESELLPVVDTVPSAVGEIAKRQAEGYGYLKVP